MLLQGLVVVRYISIVFFLNLSSFLNRLTLPATDSELLSP